MAGGENDQMTMMIGLAVAYIVYDYLQNRGKKKHWRLPFWESIGVVDIIVFPIMVIVVTPAILRGYERVKKVFSVQRNKPHMQQLKTGLAYIGMDEDFNSFFDPHNYSIKYNTEDVIIFGILIASIGFLNMLTYPNKLLGTDDDGEEESESESDSDDDEPAPKKTAKKEKKPKKEKKQYAEEPAKPKTQVLDAVEQKKRKAAKVPRKMGKDYYGDQNKYMGGQ